MNMVGRIIGLIGLIAIPLSGFLLGTRLAESELGYIAALIIGNLLVLFGLCGIVLVYSKSREEG